MRRVYSVGDAGRVVKGEARRKRAAALRTVLPRRRTPTAPSIAFALRRPLCYHFTQAVCVACLTGRLRGNTDGLLFESVSRWGQQASGQSSPTRPTRFDAYQPSFGRAAVPRTNVVACCLVWRLSKTVSSHGTFSKGIDRYLTLSTRFPCAWVLCWRARRVMRWVANSLLDGKSHWRQETSGQTSLDGRASPCPQCDTLSPFTGRRPSVPTRTTQRLKRFR